jgi:hypothetical protein
MRVACHFRTAFCLALLCLSTSLAGQTDTNQGDAIFLDGAAASGLNFVHFNGMSGETYYAEMVGGGGALIDYDNDGDLDIYLVQGTMMGREKNITEATFAPQHPLPLTDRLYRNDTDARSPNPKPVFTDVTAAAGITASLYGMGVATGDFDNDGWTDLYVSNFGSNQLLRNNGDGTFSDTTADHFGVVGLPGHAVEMHEIQA